MVAHALDAHDAETATPASDTHLPGEPGVWILLFGDLGLFSILFAVYLHERGKQPILFAESQETLNRSLGAINTLVLLTSSLLLVLATLAFRNAASRHHASRLIAGAAALGVTFIVIKVFEYHEKIAAGITPSSNGFYMYYFVLTGLHLVHLIVGLGVLFGLSRLARKSDPTRTHIAFFEGGACFWHIVDLLWIVIFPLVFLVR